MLKARCVIGNFRPGKSDPPCFVLPFPLRSFRRPAQDSTASKPGSCKVSSFDLHALCRVRGEKLCPPDDLSLHLSINIVSLSPCGTHGDKSTRFGESYSAVQYPWLALQGLALSPLWGCGIFLLAWPGRRLWALFWGFPSGLLHAPFEDRARGCWFGVACAAAARRMRVGGRAFLRCAQTWYNPPCGEKRGDESYCTLVWTLRRRATCMSVVVLSVSRFVCEHGILGVI